MKAIRFGDLVRHSGRPHPLLLFSQPEKNRGLQQAIRSNRVVTVHQQNVGTKRDFGIIGFERSKPATYLVFPRPLKAGPGLKVNGINYSLLEDEEGDPDEQRGLNL